MNSTSPWGGAVVLVLLGTALGLATNALSPKPLDWIAQPRTGVSLDELTGSGTGGAPGAGDRPAGNEAGKPDRFSDIPSAEFPIEVDLDRTRSLFDRGIILLDARDKEEFLEGHIRGARSTPYNAIAGDLELMEELASHPEPVLVYCGGGNCELSMDLAFELISNGHSRVLVFMGGYAAWDEAGYPVQRGEAHP